MKILYLEDNVNLSQTVQECLEDNGYTLTCVYDGQKALEAVYKEHFDLLLLDVNVPKIDGFALLKELRDSKIFTPAIFITSLNSINDLSNGYDVGADDYIKKPFAIKELLFRIKAILKREFKAQEESFQITDNSFFNTQKEELSVNEIIVSINPKEISLLKLLLKHKNEAVSFELIYQNVWSYNEIHSELSLRTYIKNLRKHLGKESILSIKKVGYKLQRI